MASDNNKSEEKEKNHLWSAFVFNKRRWAQNTMKSSEKRVNSTDSQRLLLVRIVISGSSKKVNLCMKITMNYAFFCSPLTHTTRRFPSFFLFFCNTRITFDARRAVAVAVTKTCGEKKKKRNKGERQGKSNVTDHATTCLYLRIHLLLHRINHHR